MERGDVWWAEMPDPVGSGPGFRRPVLIVQSNNFNKSRIRTVLVVTLTSNLRLAEAPGNVLASGHETGLSKDSVANVSQLVTIDREFLTEKTGKLPVKTMRAIDEGLRLVLSP